MGSVLSWVNGLVGKNHLLCKPTGLCLIPYNLLTKPEMVQCIANPITPKVRLEGQPVWTACLAQWPKQEESLPQNKGGGKNRLLKCSLTLTGTLWHMCVTYTHSLFYVGCFHCLAITNSFRILCILKNYTSLVISWLSHPGQLECKVCSSV